MDYIEEGLFNNPYKNIIKEYKNQSIRTKYDYEKSYKSTQTKVISELSKHLKSINGIKIEGDECNDTLTGSIHIYTKRSCLASEQAKIDEKLKEYKFNKSYNPIVNGNPVKYSYIALIDDSIISVYFEDSYDLALREREYSNDVSFKIIYSKGDAKELGIPTKVIYDIISKFKQKPILIITPAYVFIGGIPKNEGKKIINSLHYKTHMNAVGGIYIFNSKIVSSNNESYIEEGFFKKKKPKHYVQPTREDYNKAISIAKKILFKEPLLKKAYKVMPYKIDKEYPNEVNILDYSFRDDRLPYMAGDEWHNFLDNIDSPAIVKLEEELEKYDIEMHVDGTKDGTVYIKKYTYSTNESYTPERGEIKMKSINTLASIARMNGIEITNRLRDDIVSEYTDIVESLSIVDESVIVKDISLLPVYSVNENTFISNEDLDYNDIESIEPVNEDAMVALISAVWVTAGTVVVKNRADVLRAVKIYEKNNPDIIKFKDLDRKVYSRKSYSDDKVKEYKLFKDLKCSTIEEYSHNGKVVFAYAYDADVSIPLGQVVTVSRKIRFTFIDKSLEKHKEYYLSRGMIKKLMITKDLIKWAKETIKDSKSINEGYAIDLDSLKYVVESKGITLEEAIQEIRDVNYIGDTFPMYCVLPENINENMTLESFITLNETLNKYEITPICNRVINGEEFISEAGKIAEAIDKVADKFKSLPVSGLEKIINSCEKENTKIDTELKKIRKMDQKEQGLYVAKQNAKNLGLYTLTLAGSAAGGTVAGTVYGMTKFLGVPMIAGVMTVIPIKGGKIAGKISLTPNMYINSLESTKSFNKKIIKKCEQLKAKK